METKTIEDAVEKFFKQFSHVFPVDDKYPGQIDEEDMDWMRGYLEITLTEIADQSKREERKQIANALVDALPTGTINAFEIIKAIKKFQEELLNT